MRTFKKVEVVPVFVENIPEELEENKFYISEQYKVAVHLCLCGCREKVITPLTGGNRFWDLVKEPNGTITLKGSVGSFSLPCKSHYIITKNIANFC